MADACFMAEGGVLVEPRSVGPVSQRAHDALMTLIAGGATEDCLLPAAVLATGHEPSSVAPALLKVYRRREPAYGRDNSMRYRWGLGFRGEAGDALYARPENCRSWRPAESAWQLRDPAAYARRILLPVALATQLEYWSLVAAADDEALAAAATALLDEAQQTAETDVAKWVAADDPWADTFALWTLTAYPRAHARLRDMVFALAVRYGQISHRYGLIHGLRHPFWHEPLVSASAQLAHSLWRLGIYPTLLPGLIDFVRQSRRDDGGWADHGQPSDVLTTLVAASLLADVDPTFDPSPTVAFFEGCQEPAGWWRALNPEVPWLTGAVAAWIDRSAQSFSERFSWPELPVWSKDRTTGLPTMAVFDELAAALAGISGLADASLEVAFIDLAGFGAFNNRYGMDAGDAALAAYAAALSAMPRTMVIRQGGDELLVLGVPGHEGLLEPQLLTFMDTWGDVAAERAGVPRGGVVPRVLLASGAAGELRRIRGRLGTAIGPMKKLHAELPIAGILQWI